MFILLVRRRVNVRTGIRNSAVPDSVDFSTKGVIGHSLRFADQGVVVVCLICIETFLFAIPSYTRSLLPPDKD